MLRLLSSLMPVGKCMSAICIYFLIALLFVFVFRRELFGIWGNSEQKNILQTFGQLMQLR